MCSISGQIRRRVARPYRSRPSLTVPGQENGRVSGSGRVDGGGARGGCVDVVWSALFEGRLGTWSRASAEGRQTSQADKLYPWPGGTALLTRNSGCGSGVEL